MNKELGLRILSEIMAWTDEQARIEFRWLSFTSTYKYDGYRGYLTGVRFIESLAIWLQQFAPEDRKHAYNYIKNNLIYFSPAEIQRLIESFFPEVVQKQLIDRVSDELGIEKYLVWSTLESQKKFRYELRKTLFMGLSDGARLDSFRRVNANLISNEQVVLTTEINQAKWISLIKDLQSDLIKIDSEKGTNEKFSRVFLIDDFTASGTSFIREDPIGSGNFKGKIFKFLHSLKAVKNEQNGVNPFINDFEIVVHHYISTAQAVTNIKDRYQLAKSKMAELKDRNIIFSYGMILKNEIALDPNSSEPFVSLCNKYYDESLYDHHFEKSGAKDAKFGYGNCGLPVVLEHNTPNNSLPLLWAETFGENGAHAIRPLFRRSQRHTEFIG